MDTPICDFVQNYIAKDTLRLHMPGHKGGNFLGYENADITEIFGADSLYEARGIIKKSEENASALFGADTFYSAEGSSLSIRAMLYLAITCSKKTGGKPCIFAGRNAHKAFLSAAAMLDFDIEWIFGKNNYLSCEIEICKLDEMLSAKQNKPAAVYITSPDYLGNIQDIEGISKVCRKHGVLLLVDNAHGAYLKFLENSKHPIDLGADMCCDSAHKTLPVLTGGGYLHISKKLNPCFKEQAKNALSLFGSTSPSYLILQSLDRANVYLEGYKDKLKAFLPHVLKLKDNFTKQGLSLAGDEPLKLTVMPKSYGYTGQEFAEKLRENNIECEFSDPDFAVMMLTPETDMAKLQNALENIQKREKISVDAPMVNKAEKVFSVRDACLKQKQKLTLDNCLGKILATGSLNCPPAVAPVVCGERVDLSAIECFKYYGTDSLWVVKEEE